MYKISTHVGLITNEKADKIVASTDKSIDDNLEYTNMDIHRMIKRTFIDNIA